MSRPVLLAAVVVAGVLVGGCGGDGGGGRPAASTAGGAARCRDRPVEHLVPRVVREVPHDPDAFVQGLVVHDGLLYESDGLEGRSALRVLDPRTGEELEAVPNDPAVFAEGLAVADGDELVQLTWKDGTALRWSLPDLEPAGRFSYRGEGWGLTTSDDGTLLMSDGSDTLTERDPQDFRVLGTWPVDGNGEDTDRLNELEWDGEHLWANRWKTDDILRVDLRCRQVDGVVDASVLTEVARVRARAGGSPVDVLNGIAHLPGTDRFLVTGKLWPVMFEVRFEPG